MESRVPPAGPGAVGGRGRGAWRRDRDRGFGVKAHGLGTAPRPPPVFTSLLVLFTRRVANRREGPRGCKAEGRGNGRKNGFARSPRSASLDLTDPPGPRPENLRDQRTKKDPFPSLSCRGCRPQRNLAGKQGPGRQDRGQGRGGHPARAPAVPAHSPASAFVPRAYPGGKDSPYPGLPHWRAQCLPPQPEARVAPGEVRRGLGWEPRLRVQPVSSATRLSVCRPAPPGAQARSNDNNVNNSTATEGLGNHSCRCPRF